MLIDNNIVQEAKNKLGSAAAYIIAEILEIENFDEKNLKGNCPIHSEKTPSFIWNTKANNFKCFGCGVTIDIIDAYMRKGDTYMQAVQKLFELTETQYIFGEIGVKTKRQYYYPKPRYAENNDKVYDYLSKRKISQKTADYLNIKQNIDGNLLYQFYDLNDVLTMVKVRKSAPVPHGELKCWWLKDENGKPFDTSNILYNMNRVSYDKPLLIVSGEGDCAAAIEAGYLNTVSIPMGDQNTKWVEECLEFLDRFDCIIICPDNDESGMKYCKDIIPRLGSWKCKIASLPEKVLLENGKTRKIKDLNEYLYYCGKEKVLDIIYNAKDTPVPSVNDLSDVKDIDLDEIGGIETGIEDLDKQLMRIFYGTLTVISGSPGCVDKDTEYFNGYTWKKISEYTDGESVLQYNEDGSAELVKPIQYHKYPCDRFWHLHSTYGIEQCVSDEHNMVYTSSKGNLCKKNVVDLINMHNSTDGGFAGKFITTFSYSGKGIGLTDEEIRVMCAVICDGHFPNMDSPKCRINIKKKNKKERLHRLLQEANIPYTVEQYNPHDLEYHTFYFEAPVIAKIFSHIWYDCTQQQLQVVVDEILHWGVSQIGKRKSFSSTALDNVNFVQFAFGACGYRSVLTENDRSGQKRGKYIRKSCDYKLNITKSNSPSLRSSTRIKIPSVPSQDGYKYCFTVPSGMLVLRRKGRINITGNSGKSSLITQLICSALDQDKNCWLFSGELPEFMTKNWFNYILAGNRHIKTFQQPNGDAYYKVTNSAKHEIDEYYRGKWFVYKDDYDNNIDTLIDSMTDVVRKYGVKLCVLDNMMTIDNNSSDDELKEQTATIKKLIAFSKKYNIATILVSHPRKLKETSTVGIYDIAGTSNIVNLAHRTIGMRRITQEEKEGTQSNSGLKNSLRKYDVVINIIKDRLRGRSNINLGLHYDSPSRRFFTNPKEYDRKYGWDKNTYTDTLPYPVKDETAEIFGHIAPKYSKKEDVG